MGVKGLFNILYNAYPDAFKTNVSLKLDRIYLDANALLYPIAEHTKIPEEIAFHLLQTAQAYSERFGCKCNIYMDGPAHMGKIRQQRMRRFLYSPSSVSVNVSTIVGERKGDIPVPSMIKSDILGINVPTIVMFSPAMFSPGTEMMERIHIYIINNIKKYQGIDVYSSYHEPGEGEHKIIRNIKNISLNRKTPFRTAIVGKDADLLLLGMSITQGEGWNIVPYIIRHNDRLGEGGRTDGYTPDDPLFIIDCNILRTHIITSMKQNTIWNFIIATFVMGNDFLPPVPEMSNVYNAIPLIQEISPVVIKRQGDRYVIDWNGFSKFLLSLANSLSKDNKVRNDTYRNWLQGDNKDISIDTFEDLYYFHMSPFPVYVDGLILAWLSTIQWNFIYYHDGLDAASVAWQYPIYYAPALYTLTTSSIWNNSEMPVKVLAVSTRKVEYLTPVQALCAILPRWLHNIIPSDTRKKLGALKQYYPYSFYIQNPTGDPIIPVIPYDEISSI